MTASTLFTHLYNKSEALRYPAPIAGHSAPPKRTSYFFALAEWPTGLAGSTKTADSNYVWPHPFWQAHCLPTPPRNLVSESFPNLDVCEKC